MDGKLAKDDRMIPSDFEGLKDLDNNKILGLVKLLDTYTLD